MVGSGRCSWGSRLRWRGADALDARERLDDDHGRAAVPAHEGRRRGPGGGLRRFDGRRYRCPQELASDGQVLLAPGVGQDEASRLVANIRNTTSA